MVRGQPARTGLAALALACLVALAAGAAALVRDGRARCTVLVQTLAGALWFKFRRRVVLAASLGVVGLGLGAIPATDAPNASIPGDRWWLEPSSRAPAPGAVPPELVYLWDRYADRGDRRLLALRADTGQPNPVIDQPWPGMFNDRLAFSPDGARLYMNRNALRDRRWISTVEGFDAGRPAQSPRLLYRAEVADGGFGAAGGPDAWAAPVPAPDGRTLYLLRQERTGESSWRDWIDVLDLPDGARRTAVPLGNAEAHGDWLRGQTTADGRFLYVHRTRVLSSQPVGASLFVIDGRDGRLTGERAWDSWPERWTAAAGPVWCFGWRIAPDGREAYCPTRRGNTFGLEVLAAPDWRPAAFVPLPNQPVQDQGPGETHAHYTPDGRALLYVAGWGDDRAVMRVDLVERRVTARALLGAREERAVAPLDRLRAALVARADAKKFLPAPAALSPDGRTLYAALQRVGERFTDPRGVTRTERGDGIAALDAADLTPRLHLLAGRELWGDLAVSPDGRRLYATDRDNALVYVLDAATGAELARWAGFAARLEGIEGIVPAMPEG